MTLLTPAEVAAQLKVSRSTVYALCAANELKHHRVGIGRGSIRVTTDAIAQYLGVTPEEVRPAYQPKIFV
jgi:excisionase family DNA binding protein